MSQDKSDLILEKMKALEARQDEIYQILKSLEIDQANNQALKTINDIKEIIDKYCSEEEFNMQSFLKNYEIKVDDELNQVWEKALELIEGRLSTPSFETWFSEIELVANNDNKLIFLVRNEFQADWLETRYLSMMKEVVEELTGRNFEFVFSLPTPELVDKIENK